MTGPGMPHLNSHKAYELIKKMARCLKKRHRIDEIEQIASIAADNTSRYKHLNVNDPILGSCSSEYFTKKVSIMCHIEVVMLEPCQCQLFPYSPQYCQDFNNAHPEVRPPWTPTILCDEAVDIGDLDLLQDGIRFQVLSKTVYNDLQFFDCRNKEYFGVEVGDRCIYHEHLKVFEMEKQREDAAVRRVTRVLVHTGSSVKDIFIRKRDTTTANPEVEFTWEREVEGSRRERRSVRAIPSISCFAGLRSKDGDAEKVGGNAARNDTGFLERESNIGDLTGKRATTDLKKADGKDTEENLAFNDASLWEDDRIYSPDLVPFSQLQRPDVYMQKRREQRRSSGSTDIFRVSGPSTPPANEYLR